MAIRKLIEKYIEGFSLSTLPKHFPNFSFFVVFQFHSRSKINFSLFPIHRTHTAFNLSFIWSISNSHKENVCSRQIWKIIEINLYTVLSHLPWTQFWSTVMHSQQNVDFCQKNIPQNIFVNLPCSDFEVLSQINKIWISCSVVNIRVGEQLIKFLITSIFETVCFLKLGLIFVDSYSSEQKSNQKIILPN